MRHAPETLSPVGSARKRRQPERTWLTGRLGDFGAVPGPRPATLAVHAALAMHVKIKICGITSPEDGLAAAEAGADLIGLVFFRDSPRHVPLERAETIATALPAHVERAGVFVNAPAACVQAAIERCGLHWLQFHGDEPPEFCAQFGLRAMKAFRLRDAASLELLCAYRTDAWLLDAWSPGQRGGTGASFNWDLAVEAGRWGRPIFLAGGLTPENVAEAIRRVRPFGVDVSSGVEASPGRKDSARMQAFVRAARAAAATVD